MKLDSIQLAFKLASMAVVKGKLAFKFVSMAAVRGKLAFQAGKHGCCNRTACKRLHNTLGPGLGVWCVVQEWAVQPTPHKFVCTDITPCKHKL